MTRSTRLPGVLFAAICLLGIAPNASAQNFTWNTDAPGDWTTAANWNPVGIPDGQGVGVIFGNVITANRTVTLNSNVAVGSIAFENTAFSYTIDGTGILTLDNGGSPASIAIASSVTANQTITRHLMAASDVAITNNSISGLLTLSGGINLGGHTITVDGPGTVNFSNNPITGTAGSKLVLNGPGAVQLSSINNGLRYEVNGGTLIAFANNSLQPIQAGVLTPDLITLTNGGAINFHAQQTQRDFIGITLGAGGGRIDSDAAGPVILSAPITGAGSLTKTGTQTIALSALNTYTGETIIRQGPLRIDVNAFGGSPGALGNATSAVILGDNGGGNSTALYIGANGVSLGRDITVVASPAPGSSTVTIGIRPADVSAVVSGNFSGPLTLNRSVVLSVIGGTGSTVGFSKITGTGDITIGGVGTVTFNSSLSDFVGTITLDSGTLAINDDAKLGAATNGILFDSATLRITGSTPFSTSRPITLLSSGISGSKIDVINSDTVSGFTIDSEITGIGPLHKTGPGILTLAGANTYNTTTRVEAGTLQAAGPFVLSPNSTIGVHAGATVKLNGFSQQVARIMDGSPSSFGTIDLGSNPSTVLTVGQNGVSKQPILFQGQIVGQGDLVFTGNGSQWMGGNSSYLGTTTVRQGIVELRTSVQASGNGPLGHSDGGAIRLGDANFAGFNAAITSTDKSIDGFARPITVVAGAGTRTIGHRLHGGTHDGSTVTFSGPIALEKDLHLYTLTTGDYVGADFRVSGVVSGSGGLIKIGGGELQLTADNTYTGATTIQNGRLLLGGSAAAARSSSGFVVGTTWSNPGLALDTPTSPAPTDTNFAEFVIQDFSPNANRLGDVDVTLAHGTFAYAGRSGGASSESFRNLVLARGPNTLTVTTGDTAATTSAALSMTGGFVRNNNSTLVVFSPAVLGNPDGQNFTRVLATSGPALLGGGGTAGTTNISIIPWAYHDTDPGGTAITTESFLTHGPTGLRPLVDSEYVTALTAPGTLNNVRLIAAATTLSQNQTINSLRYGLSATGTITLDNNARLTIDSGAILSTASNTLTFTGGEIAFGAREGVFLASFGSDIVINSVVSGTGGLTSSTNGDLTLNSANTYTGPTTINAGGVRFNSAASFGPGGGPIRFHNALSGRLTYTGAGPTTLPNAITIPGGSMFVSVTNGGTLTLTGVIDGIGPTTSVSGPIFAAGTGVIELRGNNTFTGPLVQVPTGTVGIISDNNLGAVTNLFNLGSGTSNPTLRFDAAGIDIARTVNLLGSATINTNGNHGTISGTIFGASSAHILTKTGAGTLTLTGTKPYSATTTVAGGTLLVNGTLTNSFGGGVNVNNGGTLGGTGTINRLVRVNTGGSLDPGALATHPSAGVGTLTLGALEFGSSATANFLWEAGAAAQDQIVVTSGPVNLTGITVNLGLFDRGLGTNVTPAMQFPLLTVAGTNSITGFNPANFNVFFTDTPNWSTGQYSLSVVELNGNTSLVLSNISPVPEPAGLLAIAGAALGLAAWRRRRWHAVDISK